MMEEREDEMAAAAAAAAERSEREKRACIQLCEHFHNSTIALSKVYTIIIENLRFFLRRNSPNIIY